MLPVNGTIDAYPGFQGKHRQQMNTVQGCPGLIRCQVLAGISLVEFAV